MKTFILKAMLCTMLASSTMAFANEAFDKDAQEYAKLHGVSIDEARQALNIELHRDDIIDLIENQYKGRLAGIYIENTPTYKIVVKLKGNGRNEKKEMALGKALPNINVPVEFIYGAKTTKDVAKGQLQKAQKLAQQYLTGVQMVSYNDKTGQIDIEINAQNTSETQSKISQLQKAWKNPHLDLNIIFVSYSIGPMSVAYGGTPVVDKSQVATTGMAYDCTTGFGVKDSQGNQYMSTAAHCPNNFEEKATGIKYSFVGEIPFSQSNDFQWNSTTATISNKFRDGATTTRTLTGRRTLGKTAMGDTVCHYGNTTGYSCAKVSKVGASISEIDAKNGHLYPGNFWVRVNTPTCGHGDSGGPAFTAGTIASGIVSLAMTDDKTKKCIGYLYLPTDKIYENGFSFIY